MHTLMNTYVVTIYCSVEIHVKQWVVVTFYSGSHGLDAPWPGSRNLE